MCSDYNNDSINKGGSNEFKRDLNFDFLDVFC